MVRVRLSYIWTLVSDTLYNLIAVNIYRANGKNLNNEAVAPCDMVLSSVTYALSK